MSKFDGGAGHAGAFGLFFNLIDPFAKVRRDQLGFGQIDQRATQIEFQQRCVDQIGVIADDQQRSPGGRVFPPLDSETGHGIQDGM